MSSGRASVFSVLLLLVAVTVASIQLPGGMWSADRDPGAPACCALCRAGCCPPGEHAPGQEDTDSGEPDECPDCCPCQMVRNVIVFDFSPLFAHLTLSRGLPELPLPSHGRLAVSSIDRPPRTAL